MGLGLQNAYGIQGGQESLDQILAQRRAEALLQQKMAQQEFENRLQTRQLDEQSAYRKEQEAQRLASQQADQQAKQVDDTRSAFNQMPAGTNVSPIMGALRTAGLSPMTEHQDPTLASRNIGMGAMQVPSDVTERTGILYTQSAPAMPARDTKLPSGQELQLRETNARADETAQRAASGQAETMRHNKAMENKPSSDQTGLVKIERIDPATGRTIVEYMPKSDVRGKSFEKPSSATVQNRIASAQAVNQTGEDIIAKLSEPAYKAAVGPLMGRASRLQDFLGNPPPEFAELAGQIESYALANMGVHGMRSAQGAEQIKRLLEGHHTPESLIAAIKGLNAFSEHFMKNEGMNRPATSAPAAGATAPSGAGGFRVVGVRPK